MGPARLLFAANHFRHLRSHVGGQAVQKLWFLPLFLEGGGFLLRFRADPCLCGWAGSSPGVTSLLAPSRPQEEPSTWTGYFGKMLLNSTSYLPSQVTEMFNQGRAFATVRLPFCGHKNICSLTT